jgi:hypothetical protein
MTLTHYAVLGIAPNADGPAIDQAFQTQLADCRPDETARRKAILAAFHILSNPERRAAYDREFAAAALPPAFAAPPAAPVKTGRPVLAAIVGIVAGTIATFATGWLIGLIEGAVIGNLPGTSADPGFASQFIDTPLAAIHTLGLSKDAADVFTKIDLAMNVIQAVLVYQFALWVARKISASAKEGHVALGLGIVAILSLLLVVFVVSIEGNTEDHTLEMLEWLVFVGAIIVSYKRWWKGFQR